jgi:hypothetical protein
MNETKPWYVSRTVWIGAAQIAIGAATAAGMIDLDAAQDAQAQAPEVVTGLVNAALGAGAVYYRIKATKQVS